MKRARDTKPSDAGADAFAFGSHSAFEYMAGELKTLFEDFYTVRDKLAGKPVLLFTTGQGGQSSTLASIDRVVGVFNPDWVKPGVAVEGAPKEADKARAREMGKKLAEAAKKKAKCAGAFGAKESALAYDISLSGEYEGHPSFRELLVQGYQVITF